MSILSMVVSKKANPKKQTTLKYNSGFWTGNLNVSSFEFRDFNAMNNYLKNKYKKVHYFRINMGITFGGTFFQPRDVYADDMDNDSEPNCIMVEENGKLKLVVTKATRGKEFVTFSSAAKNTYIPVFVYKTNANIIKLINFK